MGLVLIGAFGCSAELEQYSSDAESGSTHALVSVQRSTSVDGTTARADAFAGIVRVPADVESRPLFEMLGLVSALPPVGQCRAASSERDSAQSLATIGHVELLETGDVMLGIGGSEMALAPHAFPSVTDTISGVLYTTRDRSSSALPPDTRYTLRTTGGAGMAGISVGRDAPPELEAVKVNGIPLAEIGEIVTNRPVDLTWGVGAPGDLLYVEIGSGDGQASSLCTFRDETGWGSIAEASLPQTGAGRLSLHRVRTAEFSSPGVDAGEVTFDFELAADVSFSR